MGAVCIITSCQTSIYERWCQSPVFFKLKQILPLPATLLTDPCESLWYHILFTVLMHKINLRSILKTMRTMERGYTNQASYSMEVNLIFLGYFNRNDLRTIPKVYLSCCFYQLYQSEEAVEW